ncbi:MAG TPA: hypothetical protein VJX67_21960 [Blastocatellia bacterium]|nr:hypothetical protein [Blastocatellia bacterium]
MARLDATAVMIQDSLRRMKKMKLGHLAILGTIMLVTIGLGGQGRERHNTLPTDASPASERWEYLVLAGGNVNLHPTGDLSMRKLPDAGFSREAFPLEQNLDKVGARGWELTAVENSPAGPVYYFKRRM